MFRDLYRSVPYHGMIYVAMKVSLPGSFVPGGRVIRHFQERMPRGCSCE